MKALKLIICLALILSLSLSMSPGQDPSAQAAAKLDKDQQERLALELFQKMAQADEGDYETFNTLYRRVIDECPDTQRAEMAHWRLSNLLTRGYEPPRQKEAIALLEQFINRYPRSEGLPHVKQRLTYLYEQTGQHCQAAGLYGELAPRIKKPPDRKGLAWWVLYAEALEKCGKKAEAKKWYQKVVKASKDKDSMQARTAREGLERLK